MTHHVIVDLVLAGFAGLVMGLAYFGSLWLTVRGVPTAERPLRRLLFGSLVRLAILLPALYLVMDGRWERLLACLAGFLIARFVLLRRFRPASRGPGLGPAKRET